MTFGSQFIDEELKVCVFYLYCKIRNSISSIPKHVFPFYDRFFSVMRA